MNILLVQRILSFKSCTQDAGIHFELDPVLDWYYLPNTNINNMDNSLGSTGTNQANDIASRLHPGKLVVFFRYGDGNTPTGNGFSDRMYRFVGMPSWDASGHDIGRLAHDIGHYFGLAHPFPGSGDTDTDEYIKTAEYIKTHGGTPEALDGDKIPDTPPEAGERYYKINVNPAKCSNINSVSVCVY